MEDKKYFWTTKNGEKINIDDMSKEHLRNALKLLIRRIKYLPKKSCSHNTEEINTKSFDNTPYCDDYLWDLWDE